MSEIIRIDESTTRIEDGHVRFFLLEGREKALLIDTGMTSADAKEIAESLQHIQSYRDRFDTVYASHGTFEVKPEMIDSLIAGAKEIIAGNVTGTEVDIFGRKACLYRFPYAGFLCDL